MSTISKKENARHVLFPFVAPFFSPLNPVTKSPFWTCWPSEMWNEAHKAHSGGQEDACKRSIFYSTPTASTPRPEGPELTGAFPIIELMFFFHTCISIAPITWLHIPTAVSTIVFIFPVISLFFFNQALKKGIAFELILIEHIICNMLLSPWWSVNSR